MKQATAKNRHARPVFAIPDGAELVRDVILVCAARATVFTMSPFGFAMLCGGNKRIIMRLMLFALVTSWVSPNPIKYILAGVMFFVGVELLPKKIRHFLIAAAAMLVSGLISMIWTGNSDGAVFLLFAEVILTASMTYLYDNFSSFSKSQKAITCAVAVGAAINGLSGLELPLGIEPSVVVSVLLVLLVAVNGSSGTAVICGVVLGLIGSASGGNSVSVMGIYALSGLFAALLRDLGRMGAAVGVVCAVAICLLFNGSFFEFGVDPISVVAACGLFVIMPKRLFETASEWLCEYIDRVTSKEALYSFLASKLRAAAVEYNEITAAINRLTREIETIEVEEETEEKFHITAVAAQKCAEGQVVCGDSMLEYHTENGKDYYLLCDGMGSGGEALRESRMTAELFIEFIKTGFLKDKAVGMVNSAIALRCGNESFSTVDLIEFDRMTGRAEFLKIGSAPSYLRHADRVEAISAATLPMGILTDEVESCTIVRELNCGDVVLMVSDGISEAGHGVIKGEWIKRLLRCENVDLKILTERIIENAVQKNYPDKSDDMTVIALRVDRIKKIPDTE